MMPISATYIALAIVTLTSHFSRYFSGKYTRGDGNNTITSQHGHGSDNLAKHRLRSNIAIANGRNGHNSPINTSRNTSETILRTLN